MRNATPRIETNDGDFGSGEALRGAIHDRPAELVAQLVMLPLYAVSVQASLPPPALLSDFEVPMIGEIVELVGQVVGVLDIHAGLKVQPEHHRLSGPDIVYGP